MRTSLEQIVSLFIGLAVLTQSMLMAHTSLRGKHIYKSDAWAVRQTGFMVA